jgi:hypothetical protein
MDCNFFCWQQIWNLVVGEQIGWCGFVYFTCFGEQFNVKLRCYGIVVILKRDVHERKIRYCWFLKAYLIYKFNTSICDGAWRWGRPGSAQPDLRISTDWVRPGTTLWRSLVFNWTRGFWARYRTRGFRPIRPGPAQHCDGAWLSRRPGPAQHSRTPGFRPTGPGVGVP